MKHTHTHYAPGGDLLDRSDFQLTVQSARDPDIDLRAEMARRKNESDRQESEKNQTDWLKYDTRMIDGAIDGRCIIEERAEPYGINALSDAEILTLHTGSSATSVALLATAGSIAALKRWSPEQYLSVPGIGKKIAYRLSAIFAISERSHITESDASFNDPGTIAQNMQPITDRLEVEKFWVLCLDRKNRLIKRVEISSGTLTACLIHPREFFRPAILHNAAAVVAVHNHPSGDPAPSRADIAVTRQLREAAKILGIELIDHVIIGTPANDPNGQGYYSFNDAGLV